MTHFGNDKKLDNPVWYSLNETHKKFSVSYDQLKCYQVDYCPFGGFEGDRLSSKYIDEYARLINNFFIVGKKPDLPQRIILKKELVCLQMVIDHKIDVAIKEEIVKLNAGHGKELFDLVNFVQPGYFTNKTMLLGDYYGIFKNNALIAVTGERMKMNDFTEVSAVVTHPDHTGKGFARQLIAHTVNKILNESRVPYLHVADTNTGAIQLYNKSGFTIRRKISFWNLQKI